MGAFALITASQELEKMVRAERVNGDRRIKILGEHDFETPRLDGTRETGPEPFGAAVYQSVRLDQDLGCHIEISLCRDRIYWKKYRRAGLRTARSASTIAHSA